MVEHQIFSMAILSQIPSAYAIIRGGKAYPTLEGLANFYETYWHVGLIVEIELSNLPAITNQSPRFLGLHIHENGDCGNDFANTGPHYNPAHLAHPYHTGDLPPILNSNGYAFLAFYDAFLNLDEIVGRSLIVHEQRDDFSTQPSGDSGNKIACGVITQ